MPWARHRIYHHLSRSHLCAYEVSRSPGATQALRGERARCLRLRKSVKLPLLGEGRPALCRDRHGRGVCLTQHLRETLHILYCVHLGDQRGEALSPLPPEHGIDQQVEFVGDFVERHRVFR